MSSGIEDFIYFDRRKNAPPDTQIIQGSRAGLWIFASGILTDTDTVGRVESAKSCD